MSTTRAENAINWDVTREEGYGGYLRLDLLLAAQQPRSGDHDEMLFIIIHQASELWIKLLLHELGEAARLIAGNALEDTLKILARVGRVQSQLIQSWDVLSTMTPHDYGRLRPHLGASSGFQSHQYRQLEFLLGNKDARLIDVHRDDPVHYALLRDTLNAPSLYDEVLRLLSRRGIALPASVIDRDWSLAYEPSDAVEAAWLGIYENVEKYWDFYDLAEKLVDIDDRFQQWRFRHLRTVERIIGFKRGTGGSSGVPYLSRAMELRLFPELWSLRTKL
ncbi:MAG TPA: tryptophan 2,3-dioxygenase family protein [Acetobacteraceae bacterium]|nr:tryptophan 2,3-dioxygenase family protein [Acetobacteraceae bacterium]